MGYNAQHLHDSEWMELQALYRRHGSGPEFWNAYQAMLARAVDAGARPAEAANSMAQAARALGAIKEAKLVDPRDFT